MATDKKECKEILYKLTEELCELSVEVLHLANKNKQNIKKVFAEIKDVEAQISKLKEYIFANRDDIEDG
jgi:hypothetical protein